MIPFELGSPMLGEKTNMFETRRERVCQKPKRIFFGHFCPSCYLKSFSDIQIR